MDDWSHGYDVSVGYTYGFCPEMAPDWLDLCARVAGYAPRARGPSASFRYLELGAGQGMGLCLLAAANPGGEFVGVDFQPEHIAHAQGVAEAAGLTNIRFSRTDLVDLAAAWPEDFGAFDYVALHGVYSWVSPKVREAILRCLSHAMRPGGLVYNGYNTQPGWLGTMPFQHISRLLKETTGKPGGAVFEDSIALFDRLRDGGADTFKILPGLKSRLETVRTRNTNYLVHEYLHESWRPLWHSEVAREMARADLDYIGSATAAETLLPDVLPPPLRDAIVEQGDNGLRQDLQDFVINQFFRRDIFCRGSRGRVDREIAALARTRLHLTSPPGAGDALDVKATFGEITLQRPAFAQIVDALGGGPKSVEELAALPDMRRQGMANALQILLLLLHARTLAVGAADPGAAEVAQRLNRVIARAASEGLPYDHVASSMLGSAVAVTDVDLMLLDAWFASPGRADVATLAKGVADRLARLGRTLQHDGKPLEGAGAQRRLTALATAFLDQGLPRWRRLGALL
nr:K303 [uncultured bacterium]